MQLHLDLTKDARRSSIVEQLRSQITGEGWAVITADVMSAGVPKKHHHGIVEVRETIQGLNVSDKVKEDLSAVYEILAGAEAQVHECAVDDTHFHEVGEGEAILNTLLICSAFDYIGAERVIASPVQTGQGKIECAHGLMDVPAPATAAILSMGIPVCEEKLDGELCTPTSAAIIKHFVTEFVA